MGKRNHTSSSSSVLLLSALPAVSDEEVNQMIASLLLFKEGESCEGEWANEVRRLSIEWIRAVMGQRYKKNKQKRRPFEYSEKKLIEYLLWRKKTNITSKIAQHINSDGSGVAKLTTSQGCFYWCGVDSEGSPNLWYRADKQCFDSAIIQNEMERAALVMQAGLDAMPTKTCTINFIICFDVFNLLKAMKKPGLAPAFIKAFITICPDRLKRAYMVTGNIGHMFYKLAVSLAPASIMSKVVETRSREDAARQMVNEDIVSEEEVPEFMGGECVHDEQITLNYPTMIRSITLAMKGEKEAVVDAGGKE